MQKDQLKRWEDTFNHVFDFNKIKETIIKSKNSKNVTIDNNMRVSYDFTSKKLTVFCVWK